MYVAEMWHLECFATAGRNGHIGWLRLRDETLRALSDCARGWAERSADTWLSSKELITDPLSILALHICVLHDDIPAGSQLAGSIDAVAERGGLVIHYDAEC
jgi:hypothetical protein